MNSTPSPSRGHRILAVVGWLALATAGFVALLPVALIVAWSLGARHHPENYIGGAILFGAIGVGLLVLTGWALWRAVRAARPADGSTGGRGAMPLMAGVVALAVALYFLLGLAF